MSKAPLKFRYVAEFRFLSADGIRAHSEHYSLIGIVLTSHLHFFIFNFRSLKLECHKLNPNKSDEDVAAADETEARLLPCLKTIPRNAMTRLVPLSRYRRTIRPPRHHLKRNTTKSKEKTATKRNRKSLNPNKTIRKPNQPSLKKNDRDTLRWIAKWSESASRGDHHQSLA